MKHSKKVVLMVAAVSVLVIALIIGCAVIFGFKIMQPNEQQKIKETDSSGIKSSESQVVSSNDQATTSIASSPTQEQTDEELPKASSELIRLLSLDSDNVEQLTELGCRQLVTVESAGSEAQISFYELQNNEWLSNDDLCCAGYVGHNGVTENMHEGGYATPKGLYAVGEAFYIDDIPTTGLDIFQITDQTYWVYDPDSSMYNRRVEGRENADWNSAEHMIDYRPNYDYGFVINYNTEAIYNAGSAIFFHYSGSPTAGCVGTSTNMVLQYLAVLDKTKNPYILIL